ncbi:protein kinase [Akkermansiaceae bacterium]|nr:protein kinase [Akkermansiaceae bacterium]
MTETPFNAPAPESMSSLLPGYGFTAKISGNRHGAVYFATQKSLDRQVAIKLLNPESLDAFESKASLAAGLKHPNLISIFDSGTVGGMPYLVMEFVPGKSLARSTRGAAVEFDQAMLLMAGICNGLAHAHEKGISHGHFCPSCVLLNQKAEPKIGNFGLAYSTQEDAADDITTACAAPEVLADPSAGSPQSDVYSAAAVFYELITGRRHRADARAPSELGVCRPEIDAVWKQATDPDPAKRMADVGALHASLKKAAEAGKSKLAALPKAQGREPSPAGSEATPLPSGKVGFDWKLLRNLVIIVGLLFGIHLTWQLLGKVRAARERENQEIIAKHEAAKKERALAEAAIQKVRDQRLVPQDRPEQQFEAPKETESAMESLERLRSSLASGTRTEMPAGSISRGESDYLFVSKPMSWADAAWFAEGHGGHLSVPANEADTAWLFDAVAKGKAAWIGVSSAGENTWVSVTGSIWEGGAASSGSGQSLSLGNAGTVAADGVGSQLPFIIQWHRDGSNPGKLESQLAATAKSMSQPAPLFPPGTVAFGERHYLHVPRPLSWDLARGLAESAGGHLLVVSNEEEADNLRKLTSRLDKDSHIWLGGSLEGNLWQWSTGEPWVFAQWADDASASDGNSALSIRPGGGWDGLDREEEASGFIIEWSKDPKTEATPTPDPGVETAALLARAKEVVDAAAAKRDEAIAANSKKLTWDLDSFLRNLNKSGQAEWAPHVERIKQCVRDNRLIVEDMRSDEIAYSTETLKLANYHVEKQAEIDKQFTASATTIRDAYVSKLAEIAAKAKSAGQTRLEEEITGSIREAGDLDAWLESLGGN